MLEQATVYGHVRSSVTVYGRSTVSRLFPNLLHLAERQIPPPFIVGLEGPSDGGGRFRGCLFDQVTRMEAQEHLDSVKRLLQGLETGSTSIASRIMACNEIIP
jgi:hypothetical protein